jgi:hypothetical protein
MAGGAEARSSAVCAARSSSGFDKDFTCVIAKTGKPGIAKGS